jgi:hypothetical protein
MIPRRLLLAAVCAAAAAAVLAAAAPAAAARVGHVPRSLAGARSGASGKARPARPAAEVSGAPAAARHVVIVGITGLRWTLVSAAKTPVLWRLAGSGSAGLLVDYAEHPLACPADGWLTLNSGARAASPEPCGELPAVVISPRTGTGVAAPVGTAAAAGTVPAPARIPDMPEMVTYNKQFHENYAWGLLSRLGGCATAVGPGAALALAAPSGAVPSYVPSLAALTPGLLARCPLTVISFPERTGPSAADPLLSRIVAGLPPDTLLLVTAPGADGGTPHLMTIVVSGPGYAEGMLRATSTRQPGIVTLTDLTPTVVDWLGGTMPSYLTGARITSAPRGPLAPAVRNLIGRDTAEQVWTSTHEWFFAGYAAAGVLALGVPALVFWGAAPERRGRRVSCWRIAGAFLAAVPAGTFLAGLVPWWLYPHPAAWLYAMAAAWAVVIGCAGLAVSWGRRRLDAPFGMICLGTVAVLGADVMTGSRLQLEAPFGLSLLEAGRYYGIGNNALGVYCVSALAGAAWLGMAALRHFPGRRWPAVAAAGAVGLFAVVASGWPGFGAKVGGTIAMVPCFALLLLALGGVRVGWRKAAPIALSGLALVVVFALVTYLVPAFGVSDIGAFAGDLLHGHGRDLLERKISSNVGTLTVSELSPLVPLGALACALALWRPSWLRLRTLPEAFAASPLLHVTVWLLWLVLMIGWVADDSGVIVPAAAAPFVLPLVIAMGSGIPCEARSVHYRGEAFAGSSAAGQPQT